MKIVKKIQRYFRKDIDNHITQARYFSKKTYIEIFSEFVQIKQAVSPPSRPRLFRSNIEFRLFKVWMLRKLQTYGAYSGLSIWESQTVSAQQIGRFQQSPKFEEIYLSIYRAK